MIPYTDVAVVGFVKSVFAKDTPGVVWAAPEAAKPGMAIGNQQEGLNLPGISVFRTGCDEDVNRFNQVMATRGAQIAVNPGGRTAQLMNRIPVVVDYTIVSWAQSLSDLNDIEREMWFSTRYNAVIAQIPCNSPGAASVIGTAVLGSGTSWAAISDVSKMTIGFGSANPAQITQWYSIASVNSDTSLTLASPAPITTNGPYVLKIDFRFYIKISKPSYQQEIQQQTGQIVYYQLTQTYTVAGDWVHTSNANRVLEIDLNFYQKVVSGDTITDELMTGVVITPDATTGNNPADVAFTDYI